MDKKKYQSGTEGVQITSQCLDILLIGFIPFKVSIKTIIK